MVICAGHNHAPPQRNLDGHLSLRSRHMEGPRAVTTRGSLLNSRFIRRSIDSEAVLALDRRSLVADQYQPIWRPGENPRCAGRQGAAVEARASRSTYDPAGDSGRRHLDEHSPDPRCPREDLVHWPQPHYMLRCRPCLGVPVHDHAPAGPRPVVQVVDFQRHGAGMDQLGQDPVGGTFESRQVHRGRRS